MTSRCELPALKMIQKRVEHAHARAAANERPFRAADLQNAEIHQNLDRFAHGIAADAKALRQFEFRRNLIARGQLSRNDPLRDLIQHALHDGIRPDLLYLLQFRHVVTRLPFHRPMLLLV